MVELQHEDNYQLGLTSEQLQLQDAVRSYLETQPCDALPYDHKTWRRLCLELGVTSIGLPNVGGGLVELSLVAEELGRALAASPLLASIGLARTALLACDGDLLAEQYLGRLVAGEATSTVVWAVESDDALVAAQDQGRWAISGTATLALDGASADFLLVIADVEQVGPSLFVVDPPSAATSLTRRALPPFDLTREIATLAFDSVIAAPIGELGTGSAALDEALEVAQLLLASEQLGGAQSCLDQTVRYAQSRYQFGRPIGSFQAIKHHCADMLIGVETARSAVRFAAAALDHDLPESAVEVQVASLACADAYLASAGKALQVHGGIGFTWEHWCHRHLKRARASSVLFGTRSAQRARLAELLAI